MKIIASDYDGTLNYNGISQRVRDALVHWQSLGNKFGIVSGRGFQSILQIVRDEKVSCDFLIANNGAVIADGNGQVLMAHKGCPDIVRDLADFVIDNSCQYVCVSDTEGELFLCCEAFKTTRYPDDKRYILLDQYDREIAFTQISTVCRDSAAAESLTERLNKSFCGKITALQNGSCIDIVPYGVNKARGIEDLLGFYDASHDDVATVGDNKNDIAMLDAFRSYAVANAIESIKEIAGAVVTDLAELVERELEA
jgi:Cof subfamily protein (haloacid dehalogenase superfamily)